MKNILYPSLLILLCTALKVSAQNNAALEFGAAGGPSASGASAASQAVIFSNNTNNPTGQTMSVSSPAQTVTFSLNNHQRAMSVAPGVGVMFGAAASGTTATPATFPIYNPLSALSAAPASSFMSYGGNTTNTGVSLSANYGIAIFNSTRPLFETGAPLPTPGNPVRYRQADLVIKFNTPVNNPVIHLVGLGANSGSAPNFYTRLSTELELITSGLTLTRLSGSGEFTVPNTTEIVNGATTFGATTGSGAASGSVRVNGSNISSITFRLFIKVQSGNDPNGSTWNGPGSGANNYHAGDDFLISVSAGESDLAVTKTVNNANPSVGSTVNFTITAANNGPSNDSAVVVQDLLPPGYTYNSHTTSSGTYNPATGTWNIGLLIPGSTPLLNISATLNSLQANYYNQATISGANQDNNPGNNTSGASGCTTAPATVDLNTLLNGTTPANTQLVWFTTKDRQPGTQVPDPANVTASGNYYAFFYDPVNGCYNTDLSAAAVKVHLLPACPVVTITGTVINDVNGNQLLDGPESGTNAGGLFVNLVNSSGTVIGSAAVAANGSYSITAPAGASGLKLVVTNTASSTVPGPLPGGYQYTGEPATAGNGAAQSATLGQIELTTGTTDINGQNFGIQQAPVAVADNATGLIGQPVTLNVIGNDSDPAPGTLDPTRVSLVPPPGATAISNDAQGDITGFTISGQGIWSVDPGTGAVTFSPETGFSGTPTPVNYTVRDNAGAVSNQAAITLSYPAILINGTVVHDVNNSSSIIDGSETGTNAGGPLFVYLVDVANKIIGKTNVNPDGTYSLPASPGTSYTLKLSSQDLLPNGSAATLNNQLPAGWATTGEGLNNTDDLNPDGSISFTSSSANMTEVNFGIQRLPETDAKNFTLNTQPANNDVISLNGNAGNPPVMSGSDPEDGSYTGNTGTNRNPSGIKISSLPVNGTLNYNGTIVTVTDLNNTIFTDPSLFSIVLTGGGYSQTSFGYTYVDAFGATDPTPATYTVSWSQPLPVSGLQLQARKAGTSVLLEWSTQKERRNKGFAVERSRDGMEWIELGFVGSKGRQGNSINAISYNYTDNRPLTGANYYRLKQVDIDGREELSPVVKASFTPENHITVYPKPAKQSFYINGLSGIEVINLVDVSGKILLYIKAEQDKMHIDCSMLADGIYYLNIYSDHQIKVEKIIKQQ